MSKEYHLFIRFVGPAGITEDDIDVAVDTAIREAGGEITDFILEEQE